MQSWMNSTLRWLLFLFSVFIVYWLLNSQMFTRPIVQLICRRFIYTQFNCYNFFLLQLFVVEPSYVHVTCTFERFLISLPLDIEPNQCLRVHTTCRTMQWLSKWEWPRRSINSAAVDTRARHHARPHCGAFGRQRLWRAGAALWEAAVELIIVWPTTSTADLRQLVDFSKLNTGSIVIPRFSARMSVPPDHWVQPLRPLLLHRLRCRCRVLV